jgi:two-component system, NarL family, sensor histidine kinase UhpB
MACSEIEPDGKPMSLRFRLSGLICFVLLLSLVLGSVVAYSTAVRSVRTEMQAAFLVGRQTIEVGIERLQRSGDPSRDLDQLVGSFDGNRHIRVWRSGATPVLAVPVVENGRFGRVPAWFVRIIGAAPWTERIPVAIGDRDYGAIRVETDPYNETLEVWNAFTGGLVAPTLFCVLTVLLIYWFIGRILRPLNRLAAALEEVGDGRYRTRISGRLPPELSRLRDSFNRMAVRLTEADAEKQRLNEQLLTLQEEERTEIARDLHDEVSPFLFAVNVDTAAAARLLAEGRSSEAEAHVDSIADAVRHIQREVRRMLARLRPIGLAELGLPAAIENLVAFWRRRCPEIRYRVSIAAECGDLSEMVGTTICRIVQEALSNAVRHAEAKRVTILVEECRDAAERGAAIRVVVADDGRGMAEAQTMGYGLTGLSERIAALGGRMSFSTRLGEGCTLTAELPRPRRAHTVAGLRQSAPQ